MPLVAIALLSYGAGLLAGLAGALGSAALGAAGVAAIALLRRSVPLVAIAALAAAGAAVGRAVERRDHACAMTVATRSEWLVVATLEIGPGESGEVTVLAEGCSARAWASVITGHATPGATLRAHGLPRLGPRGLALGNVRLGAAMGTPGLLPRWRERATRTVDAAFGSDAPLARALLVADTRSLSPEMRDEFAAAGLVHMLSISGLHVGLIALAVTVALGAAGLPAARAGWGSVLLTAVYVAVIGAPAPAVRAVAMLAAAAASRALQRPTSPWAALAIGAAAPLADPRLVADIGYQLSVAGMVALIAAGAVDRRWLRGRLTGWPHALALAMMTSVVACLVTGPLVAWRFGRASLIAPFANLAASPLMAVAQPILFLALVLGWWPGAAKFVAGAAHPALAAFEWVARTSAAVPGAQVEVAATDIALGVAAVASVLIVVACVSADPWRPAIGAIACAVAITLLPVVPRPAGQMELHMIDVGQGDALALRTPRGRWIVVDAGRGWAGGDAGRSTVVPYLRSRGGEVVAFVLSHPHMDHAGGAASVISATHPGLYLDPGFPGASGSYLESLAAARRTGARWERIRPGESLSIDGVTVEFLAPDSAWTASLDDANLASSVIRA
ncbi:MAG TPA: ComEC/Rec2 family competence protein, partial [Gemmatimonadaceae bacterium]|nr:ComEC/Rec2 family competence protein [Gemmatimonadaceae bacterium]